MISNYQYQAEVVFFSEEEGGRVNPPSAKYTPHVDIGEIHTSCEVFSPDVNKFEFGLKYEVLFKLKFLEREFKRGQVLSLFEGSRKTASVTILSPC